MSKELKEETEGKDTGFHYDSESNVSFDQLIGQGNSLPKLTFITYSKISLLNLRCPEFIFRPKRRRLQKQAS